MDMLAAIIALSLVAFAKGDEDRELECLKRWQNMSSVFYRHYTCYMVPKNTTDWTTANESCVEMGTRLALITDKQQMSAVAQGLALTTGLWIALVRENCTALNDSCQANQAHEGWTFVKDDASIHAKEELELWAEGQPVPGAGDAATLTTRGLENHNGRISKGYICEQVLPPSEKTRFEGRKKPSKPQHLSELNSVVKSVHDCGIECHSMASCKSYAFDLETNLCYMYWVASDALEFESSSNQFIIMDKLIEEPSYYCPTLTDENAEITYSVSKQYGRVPVGRTVSVKCKYGAQNETNATCLAPHWSKEITKCLGVCQPFTLTPHLSATYSQSLPDSRVASGETVTLECNGLYSLYVNGAKHSDLNFIVSCTAPNWDITDIECGGHILLVGSAYTGARETIESFYAEEPSNNGLEATLNPHRKGASVGVIGSKVMIASGFGTLGYLQSTTMYDPVDKTFTATPDLSFYHSEGGGVVLDGVFYICGGQSPITQSCEKFTGGTWTSIASMSVPRTLFGVVALNGKIYAMGGFDGSSSYSSVEAYDPSTDAWSMVAPLPAATYSYAAAILDGHIYMCGGYKTVNTNECYKYSDATNTWTKVASMHTTKYKSTMVEIGGKLVMMGGGSGAGEQQSVEVYDPTTDTWSMHASTLIHKRAESAAVVVK